jgi:hypothetical protein
MLSKFQKETLVLVVTFFSFFFNMEIRFGFETRSLVLITFTKKLELILFKTKIYSISITQN